ncbi:hypothetical protein L3X38_018297 [Prunus dulcis]|uniref:Uncharacterized protein n=1 Tax=Prunus dulcis TaxID=3755 RepID=A0AAD4ZAL5_PRUDU|nr:hypothetical protein L3X38_018297 [Prunus dulcis]
MTVMRSWRVVDEEEEEEEEEEREGVFGVLKGRSEGTPKLNELGLEQSQDGLPTGKLLVSSQKQNREDREGGPKRTISCYGRADPEM